MNSELRGGKIQNLLGTMQGRLVPPEDGRIQSFPSRSWRQEYPLAKEMDLTAIEWIYETYMAEVNPFSTDEGVSEMLSLADAHVLSLDSVCADVFMDCPVVGPRGDCARGTELLEWLAERAEAAGFRRIIIPFVGGNSASTEEELEILVPLLQAWVKRTRERNIEIHVETAFPPSLQGLLASEVSGLRITWDIGNSLQFGYDHKAEIEAFGSAIGTVHIKDATMHGTTVPLGRGEADFVKCFRGLRKAGFSGPFTLQGARVENESPIVTTRRYVTLVREWLQAASVEEN